MKKTTKRAATRKKPSSTKDFINRLVELKKQKDALKRLLAVIEETEKELLTTTNLFTLYDIQRTIRNEIKATVINSNDDFLKSVFADVLDGTSQTPV
jgi:sugar-specific transcriptional regulator TrmB